MLAEADQSLLLVIDVQTRLAAAMPEKIRARQRATCQHLLEAAARLAIPVLHTEQYPRGLGATEAELQAHLPEPAIEKTAFSCCAAEGFLPALEKAARRQIILAGMETHVCVLQTAFELQQRGYRVFVVEDACIARRKAHHRNALARLRQAGIIVSNSESVLFEWLRDARHPEFKAIAALIR